MQVDVVVYKVFYRLPSVDGLGPKKRLKRAGLIRNQHLAL